MELLIRYSAATNIELPVVNNRLDLNAFFLEAFNRGHLSEKTLEEIAKHLH